MASTDRRRWPQMGPKMIKVVLAGCLLGAAAAPLAPLEPWMQMGVSGLALYIVFHLVAFTLPKIHQRGLTVHTEAIEKLITNDRQANDRVCDKVGDLQDTVADTSGELRKAIDRGNEAQLNLLRMYLTGGQS